MQGAGATRPVPYHQRQINHTSHRQQMGWHRQRRDRDAVALEHRQARIKRSAPRAILSQHARVDPTRVVHRRHRHRCVSRRHPCRNRRWTGSPAASRRPCLPDPLPRPDPHCAGQRIVGSLRHFRRPRQCVGRHSRDDLLHGGWQNRRRRAGARGARPWARARRNAGVNAPDTEIQWPQARRSSLRLIVADCGAMERHIAPMVGRCTARQYQLQLTPTGTDGPTCESCKPRRQSLASEQVVHQLPEFRPVLPHQFTHSVSVTDPQQVADLAFVGTTLDKPHRERATRRQG